MACFLTFDYWGQNVPSVFMAKKKKNTEKLGLQQFYGGIDIFLVASAVGQTSWEVE